MLNTCHPSPNFDQEGVNDGFSFVSVRTDRDALRARRAATGAPGDGSLLLCRQAAGACDLRAEAFAARLRPGDMVLIDAAREVAFTGDVAAVEQLILPRHRFDASPAVVAAAHGCVIDAKSPFGLVLGGLLDAIRTPDPGLMEVRGSTAEEQDAGDALLRALVSAAASAVAEKASSPVIEPPLVRSIRDHIDANMGDFALSPLTIAKNFGLSRASLYRLWRPLGGIAEHIRDHRLNRAHLHLSAGGERRVSIARIAHLCGFPNAENFSRIYRQRYGCTPTETVASALRRRTASDQVRL